MAWLSGLTAASHKDFSPHASKTLSFSITISGYGLLGETLVKPYSSVSYKICEKHVTLNSTDVQGGSWTLKLSRNKKDLNDVTAATFLTQLTFSQLPVAKRTPKTGQLCQ